MPIRFRTHQRAFTLIELLVVIAILAVLAAILVPVFAKAREKARQATCLSNQRQIVIATQMYTDDYNDKFFPDPSTQAWSKALVAYNEKQIYDCPSQTGKGTNTAPEYGFNDRLFDQERGGVKQPSQMVFLADLLARKAQGNYSFNTISDLAPRHNNQVVVTYLDGHCDVVQLSGNSAGQGTAANDDVGLLVAEICGADTKINPIDNARLIFIPEGWFRMGVSEADIALYYQMCPTFTDSWAQMFRDYAGPSHDVYLDGYWMYQNEVTVKQYRTFCQATNRTMPSPPSWGWRDNDPIVSVSWDDAWAYATWAGAVLPTEAQWEKAARGTDGRQYPWGDTWDPQKVRCSYTVDSDVGGPVAVGSYPGGASPYGCLDMAGNVYEWCWDFRNTLYYRDGPKYNPTGLDWPLGGGLVMVFRGGCWSTAGYTPGGWDPFRTCAANGSSRDNSARNFLGFRCAVLQPGVAPPSNAR